MDKVKWRRMREASAASGAPALLRPPSGDSGDGDEDDTTCPQCDGAGIYDGQICSECNGSGSVRSVTEAMVCPTCLSEECEVPGIMPVREAALSTKQRKGLDKAQFAIPEKAPGSGSYPIPDESHARNALSRVAANGSPDEQRRVRAAVKRKFPNIEVGGGGKTKESQPLLQRLERLEETVAVFRSLREAKPGAMTPTFSTPTRVKTGDGREGYKVVLIREGGGNSEDDQWYTPDAIKEMCESGVCEGMQAYADHPDAEEEELRPERSVKQLVGSYHDIRFVAEKGPPRAEGVFVPLTTNESHPHYGWIVTLAEAATRGAGSTPICGISLYGLSAGDDMERPDGSFGRVVSMIRPASGDIVTNAGAGGGFVRQLMESARALRNRSTKEHDPMKLMELQGQIREAVKRVREADSDESRQKALDDLAGLQDAQIDEAPSTVEALTEAAPALVQKIREAATAEIAGSKEDLEKQLRESQATLSEANTALSQIGTVSEIAKGVRAAGVTDDKELTHYVGMAQGRALREADAVKRMVESDKEFLEGREAAQMERMKEALGLSGDSDVEGIMPRVPMAPADGGMDTLREAGIPLTDAA